MKPTPLLIVSILTINVAKGKCAKERDMPVWLLYQHLSQELSCCFIYAVQLYDVSENMRYFQLRNDAFCCAKKWNWAEKGRLIALWDFTKWDKLQPLLLATNV